MEEKGNKYCACLYYSANALGRVMTKMAEEAFAKTGLAPSYALILMVVNDRPGVQPKELSEIMQLTPSTVTRLLERLENKKLVERTCCGRSKEIYPTEKSLELHAQIKGSWKELNVKYTEVLGKDNAKELTTNINNAAHRLGAL